MCSGQFRHFLTMAFAALILAATLVTTSSAASNERRIWNFTGGSDGGNAATRLVFDVAGNAYGTTVDGGTFGCGTVFKLHPSGVNYLETVLWNFSCFNDGKAPHGGVTLDSAGNIYGTTVAGGIGTCTGDNCGVVWKLVPSGIIILHAFTGGSDGWGPGGPVVFDSAGNLFGETPDGGLYGKGTVFELERHGSSYQHKILHHFTGGADGWIGSLGPLLVDSHGSLYGVTEIGGTHSQGNVFELFHSPSGTYAFLVLYQFKGTPDAGQPYGGVIPDTHGNLIGTTYYGGASAAPGLGTVYELTPHGAGWSERVLHSFKGGTDGSSPTTTLVLDNDKDIYGTTSAGGRPSCDCGTLFKIDHTSGAESVVHRFGARPDGSFPYYALTRNASGDLFSSTNFGGLYNQGTIFEFTP